MNTGVSHFIARKIIATFLSTAILSLVFAIFALSASADPYNKGNEFFAWTSIYFMYIGAIILVYGNLVSIGVEYLQSKWFPGKDWLYVLILGVFGLANGLLFQEAGFALLGMLAALLYGIFDKWIFKRMATSRSVKWFPAVPIAVLAVLWGYLQFTSPEMPPFTIDDAVTYATASDGTVTDAFPKDIGKWEGMIADYEVTRETSAKQVKDEDYLVTFTESWTKGDESGTWSLSYQVERGSMTADRETGEMPPYYR